MQFKSVAAAALLASAVSAYEVLTPTLNSTVAKGESVSINWSSVDTDAEVFSIYLTNFQTAHWPPTVLSLAQNVPRDDGSINLRIPCDVSSDYGWQINFINGTNTYVIYAQSPVFSLSGDCVDPVPTPEPTPTPTPAPTGYTNTTTTTVAGPTKTAAAICTTVSSVVYATPIVWFVEPSHEAVCDMPSKETKTVTVAQETVTVSKQTVTVYADGPAPTCVSGGKPSGGKPTGSGSGSNGGYPACSGAGCPAPTTIPAGPGGYANATTASPVKPSGTGVMAPEFTGAASSVRVGAAAMIVGAVALML